MLFILNIQQYFSKKSIFVSLNQVVSIIRHKNPLRKLSTEELADSINYVNKMRTRSWIGKMRKCLKRKAEKTANWITNLIETRSDLSIQFIILRISPQCTVRYRSIPYFLENLEKIFPRDRLYYHLLLNICRS